MDNVVYLGYIPNQIIHLYFGISDILSVPSVWEEGAGLVAIEGMAAVAVHATAVGKTNARDAGKEAEKVSSRIPHTHLAGETRALQIRS